MTQIQESNEKQLKTRHYSQWIFVAPFFSYKPININMQHILLIKNQKLLWTKDLINLLSYPTFHPLHSQHVAQWQLHNNPGTWVPVKTNPVPSRFAVIQPQHPVSVPGFHQTKQKALFITVCGTLCTCSFTHCFKHSQETGELMALLNLI